MFERRGAQETELIPVVVYRWTTARVQHDEVTRPGWRPGDGPDDADTLEDEAPLP